MTENTDMKEQIQKLVKLQELDSEIFDLRSKKETFPARLKEMDDSLESKKTGAKTAEDELKKLQVAKSEKETEMQAKEDQIRKHEGDLFQIKNNKEYTALKQEIESIKADVSLLEDAIITLLDQIEAAQSRCEEEKKLFEAEKQSTDKEKESIKSEEKVLDQRLSELSAKRAEFLKEVDANILPRYQRILENRGKVAITKIDGEFCGECNMTLRPQIINEAQLRKNLVFCENCGRMLYVEE
jgi:predicted  nucleic acid-binding Zn-ribbon protein